MPQPLSIPDGIYGITADARPSNYLINHVSWPEINEATNWLKTVVVRNTSGFPVNPDDGVRIFTEVTDSILLNVSGVNATTGAISGFTLDYYPASTYTVSTTFSGIAGVTVNRTDESSVGPGSGATFNITTDGSGVPSVSVDDGGSGYTTSDYIRISGSNFGSRVSRSELGVTNKYHIYDKGTSSAVYGTGKVGAADANPGYGVTGSYANGSTASNPPNKYYYSVFVQCTKASFSSTDVNDEFYLAGTTNTNRYWRKLADVSCPVIIDKGTLDDVLTHLPSFYTRNENGSYNNDLKQFLSLFAFHLDTYLKANSSVFNASDINKVDEVLLKEWLTQLGGVPDDVISVGQLRKLVKTILTTYGSNGSTSGLKNLIETYAGYNVVVDSAINIMPDYDSSTFLNSTGKWYGDPDYPGSLATSGTFTSNILLYSGKDNSFDSFTDYLADPAYNEIANPYYDTKFTLTPFQGGSFANPIVVATATVGTITYYSTDTILVEPGDTVQIDYLTPAYYNTRGTVKSTTGNSFSIANYNGSITSPSNWESTADAVATTPAGAYTAGANLTVAVSAGTIVAGMYVLVPDGSGTLPLNTTVTTVVNATTIRLSNGTTTNFTSGAKLYFYTGSTGAEGEYAEAANGVTLRVSSTAGLKQGDKLKVITSTGNLKFPDNTVITSVVDNKNIRVNKLPRSGSPADDNDVVVASTNLSSNVMKVNTDSTATTSVGLTLGLRRVKVSTDQPATATSVAWVRPGGVAQVKDYVIDPINNSIPYGTYVSSINSVDGHLGLKDANGNKSSVTLTSGTELWFSSTYKDKTGAITEAIGVDSNKPYSFGAYFNPSTYTAHTSAVSIMWYDKNGTFLTTSSPTTIAAASLPATTWTQAQISALSPSTAMYAVPRLDITGTQKNHNMFVDAIQFTGYVNVTSRSASGTTATLYTDKPHNFKVGNSVTVKGVSTTGTPVYDGTFAITAVSQNYALDTYSFSYALSSSTETQTNVTGYASSIPINFEDARLVRIKVRPNRINLLRNPYVSATSGVNTADTTRWAYSGCSSTIENKLTSSGGGILSISARYGSTRRIPVTAGLPYTWSGYFKDTDTSATMQAKIEWYSAATGGSVLSTSSGTSIATVTTGYVRPSVTAIAPAGATYAVPIFTSTGNVTASKSMYAERFLFEASYDVGTYFDGSFDGYTKGTNKDTIWEGEPRQTRSYLYKNFAKASGLIDKLSTEGMYYA